VSGCGAFGLGSSGAKLAKALHDLLIVPSTSSCAQPSEAQIRADLIIAAAAGGSFLPAGEQLDQGALHRERGTSSASRPGFEAGRRRLGPHRLKPGDQAVGSARLITPHTAHMRAWAIEAS